MADFPLRGLFGCEPNKFSTNQLTIYKGSICSPGGDGILNFPTSTTVNLTVNGLNGLDVGTPIAGRDYFPYAISSPTTGEKGFVLSASQTYGGVALPPGFMWFRKLPFGFVYNPRWDGIPNFHLSHWPSPLVTLTDSESCDPWCAIAGGVSTGWTDIDLSSWLPDNARMALLHVQTRYSSGIGSTYLRSHGAQEVGQLVGSVTASCVYQNMTTYLRVASDRKIQFRCNTMGPRIYVYVLGYCMTEPS